ncbi:potassium-transporting ATPase subunit KdpB [Rheinheimera texasensis]|uniref:potassium-transporting ATPase subunit KdpB n=1 Tax=Rheinheimera texasensis TaxID=306205 RepID=UPI0004E1FF0B|nr:potassium-transporting ATPase subunit KdpB [Rheinheimera texasensis]
MNHSMQISAGAVRTASLDAWRKLAPMQAIKSPVMFVVWVGTLWSFAMTVQRLLQDQPYGFALCCSLILLFTVWFANFAEAIAEARGRDQAASLKATRRDLTATLRNKAGQLTQVNASTLKQGDVVVVEPGQLIPADGEIVQGVASINESALTGESAPVLREAGTDHSGVIAGTKLLSGRIEVQVTAESGHSFLDKMIRLVEGTQRQKTPNELALTVLLAALTLVFLLAVATLPSMAEFVGIKLDPLLLIALLVCLIPTTIAGLLPAIGIAGMNRALAANLIAKSGKAVEVAGDIDTLLLDKTGTITFGDRQATAFLPLPGVTQTELVRVAVLSSLQDPTPEGKSVVKLARELGDITELPQAAEFVPFSAETRLSGLRLPAEGADSGQGFASSYISSFAYKGASDAICRFALSQGLAVPQALEGIVSKVAQQGATPLVVVSAKRILGVIQLSDVIKPGVAERFAKLRALGVRTVMVTGDNPITAGAIAAVAGVDDFVAEARPEDKLALIRAEQAKGHLVAMVGDGTNDAPALAQADVGLAMNSGTQAAKDAGNMVDLDSDPTKLLAVVEVGKQLLITRGALTTFSLANDVAKYFVIIPAVFAASMPGIGLLNLMQLPDPQIAVISALIFNAVIIPLLIPLALKGVKIRAISAENLLRNNLLIYGLGGLLLPFVAIKLIDLGLNWML